MHLFTSKSSQAVICTFLGRAVIGSRIFSSNSRENGLREPLKQARFSMDPLKPPEFARGLYKLGAGLKTLRAYLASTATICEQHEPDLFTVCGVCPRAWFGGAFRGIQIRRADVRFARRIYFGTSGRTGARRSAD